MFNYSDLKRTWSTPSTTSTGNGAYIVQYRDMINRLYINPNGNPNGIKKVIFNDPATIVFWNDGTKTVVKAHDEEFDPEKGLAMAISKKLLGNKGNYYNEFKKWLPEEEERR